MGSTAIAVVLAFCNENFLSSDSDRQEFATHYLEKLRFLYEKSHGDDINVSTTTNYLLFFCYFNGFIEIQGCFPWPLHSANLRFPS